MGNFLTSTPPRSLTSAYNPSMDSWTLVQRRAQYNIWRNPITQQQLQQYRFMVNDQEEFNRQKAIFEARHTNDNLIASRFFIDDSEQEFCSGYYKGNLFIERIPFLIFEVEKIGFPEILHVYSQCLKGFAELYDAVGFFSLNEEMIGVNTDGVVKVWLNRDFGKSIPEAVYVQGSEREMMIRLVKILINYTEERLPVNIADLLLRNNPSSFRDAYITLESLSARFNLEIPDYLPSVFGRMKKMIKGESRATSYSGSQFIPQSIKSKPYKPMYKQSIATDSILSFRDASSNGRGIAKVHYHKMPIEGNHHSMANAFPDLSRISRISVPKERKPEFVGIEKMVGSPRSHSIVPSSSAPSMISKQSPVKYFAQPKNQVAQNKSNSISAENKTTELYYSGVITSKIPAESIKHLPIIRQNVNQQNSLSRPNQQQHQSSFNYYVSDHNKLTEKYLNKFGNPDQASVYTAYSQSFDLHNRSFKPKYEAHPESSLSNFSIPKKSEYGQSKSNASYYHSHNKQPIRVSRISQYSMNKSPIVSQSRMGVVYRELDQYHEPSLISDQLMLNQSFTAEEKHNSKKVNMVKYAGLANFSQQNKLGTINESFSREYVDVDGDLNGYKRNKTAGGILGSTYLQQRRLNR